MGPDVIIMIAFAVAAVLIVNQLGRVLRAMMLHRTVREALTRESNLTPELLDKIEEQRPSTGFGDDRIGLVLMALGAAMIGFALLQGSPDTIHNLLPASVFPLFVGAVLFGRHWYLARHGAGS
jgi:hypothetical protein